MAVARVAPTARVVEAGTLAAAARAAGEAGDLRLVLLDLKMPGAVGYSGIALLHAERPEVPILVVSSADGASAADEARAFGAIGFLRKDADLAAIEAAVARPLGGARPAPANRVNSWGSPSSRNLRWPSPKARSASLEAAARAERPTADANPAARAAGGAGGQAQQADRPRPDDERGDSEGAHDRDHAQTGRAKPDAGGTGRAFARPRPQALKPPQLRLRLRPRPRPERPARPRAPSAWPATRPPSAPRGGPLSGRVRQ